jgi:UDP-N-acetylglucosamine 2-epimerase (non-hydrolysing)
MLKILTVLGTRPEIIRLSEIIKVLDKFAKQKIIHTGQNYDYNLDKIFFKNLKIRKPDKYLNARGSFANQIAKIITGIEKEIISFKPDRFVVLGDTNSSLAAITAKRMGVPVYHLEAGNRSLIKNAPEEVNRKIIDHSSDILLPYSYRSAENLTKEGIPRHKIFVMGNPINEVLNVNKQYIEKSNILIKLKIIKKNYFLLTLHREENVDNLKRLKTFINILNKVAQTYKTLIIWPIHPRTKKIIYRNNYKLNSSVKVINPLGFFDFVKLEQNAKCILTDSGTVQEEASILKVPSIVLRENTERPETIESGSSVINDNPLTIIDSINLSILSENYIDSPVEYKTVKSSFIFAKIVLGKTII